MSVLEAQGLTRRFWELTAVGGLTISVEERLLPATARRTTGRTTMPSAFPAS
jgi:hypothetical protein